MLRIGVDGGGTTTRAVVVGDDLKVVGRGEAGSSNHYSVRPERAVGNIIAAIQSAIEVAGVALEDAGNWGLGLAGACTHEEQTMLHQRLTPLAAGNLVVVDEDAAAAQRGAFAGGSGAVCIAGTGANCFGINERGERARADGLGPLLGDRGSGYWIGEQTLRAICRAADGSGSPTLLLEAVLEQLQVASIDELVQLVYRPDFAKDRIAALFPIVLQAAAIHNASGDDVARFILNAAGRELAATATAVLKKLRLTRVAVTGGVLGRDTPVRAAFEAALRESVSSAEIQEPLHDAAIGAALLTT